MSGINTYIKQLPHPENIEEALQSRDFWIESAAHFHQNEFYYRDLLDECAEYLGDGAFTADDGTIGNDPIRAKIPSMVKALVESSYPLSADVDGNVFRMKPALSFPMGVPFEVPDTFNGPIRGTWYWRTNEGTIHGPFRSEADTELHMKNNLKIMPYIDVEHNWWWMEPDGSGHGPFNTLRDAEVSIISYLNTLEMA